ncbi:hypothetical protein BH10PSE19_BH10PSE19_15450 [soil metagenome]
MTLAQQYVQKGRVEGREEGREEGQVEKSREIAKRLLSKGHDVVFIAEITGLSVVEINELNAKH